jgi:hypothetical protein
LGANWPTKGIWAKSLVQLTSLHITMKEMFVIILIGKCPKHRVFKSQTKIVFDVGGIHFAQSMTIILVVHALHLSRTASWKTNGQEFKDDVIVKCDGKTKKHFEL